MRFVSFANGSRAESKLGVRSDNHIVPLATSAPDLPGDLVGLLGLADGLQRAQAVVDDGSYEPLAAHEVTLLAPLRNPGKIICLGLNYQSHLEEMGMEAPTEPTIFSKFASSIVGPEAAIRIPSVAPTRVDYEAELAVVIGRTGKDVSESEASSMVAGYTVANDISARDWQLKKPAGQWLLGKTFDTFLPLGPELVTADEIEDNGNLRITCTVSGEILQDASTSEMLFSIPETIAYISKVVTLEPGDLILTGTPAGVGMARSPRRFLEAGDVVETTVEGVGSLRNPVEA